MGDVVQLGEVKDRKRVEELTRADPHVIVTVSAWHLGAGRWWFEPVTSSRMGELTSTGYHVVGGMVSDYGAQLVRYGDGHLPKRTLRARLRRRRKGW